MPVFCCCCCFVLFCFWRLSSGMVTYVGFVCFFLVLRIILQARFYFYNTSTNKYYKHYWLNYEKSRSFPYHHHRHHLSLNRECRWGTIDDFTTSFLHFPCSPLPSGTWRTPGLSIPWYCRLFFCLPCLLLPFTVSCKIVLARPYERETCPYHCRLRLFTMVRRLSCGPIPSGSWHGLPRL